MDSHGNIYESENVPTEDAARIEGYLRAKAEEHALQRLRDEALHGLSATLNGERVDPATITPPE